FSYARSLANAVRHQRAGEPEAATQSAQAILAHADELALGDVERAKAQFALGVIAATKKPEDEKEAESLRVSAREAFSAARALAGPGELRSDSTYDLGALELLHAEAVRATIPEISGQPAGGGLGIPGLPGGAPAPAPGAPPGAAAPPGAPPDPLAEA